MNLPGQLSSNKRDSRRLCLSEDGRSLQQYVLRVLIGNRRNANILQPSSYNILRSGVMPANRQSFARNIANFVQSEGLDGVDIDWEVS
jgi:hypothetical protein